MEEIKNDEQTEHSQNKRESKSYEKVMPFLDHLEELRSRLLKSFIAYIVITIGCYCFSRNIMAFLTAPYPDKLIFLAPQESFVLHIQISFFAGLFVSLPIIFYQMWQFIVPALLEKERKYVPLIVLFSTFFFLTGALFCYYVIVPLGLKFLLSWQSTNIQPNIAIREYLKFVTLLILVSGLVFELPLISYFLAKIGLLTAQFMRKNRGYSVVAIFIVAAIITPGPDVISQLLLAGPLLILYEISIWVVHFTNKSRTKNSNSKAKS
jgi:sec-independent protein translocase protein TatC